MSGYARSARWRCTATIPPVARRRPRGRGTLVARVRDPGASRAALAGCELASLDELLRRSDVVPLHLPLSAATKGLIGRAELAAMRSSAYLVNTARAGLVDQRALADALREGR